VGQAGPHNTTYTNQTPIKDVINWNRISAHVGRLPDTLFKFLRELGVLAKRVKVTTTEVELATKAHTVKMLKIYWKAAREGGDRPADREEREDTDNESEMSNDIMDQTNPEQALSWMA
jgi:hypothetical protein